MLSWFFTGEKKNQPSDTRNGANSNYYREPSYEYYRDEEDHYLDSGRYYREDYSSGEESDESCSTCVSDWDPEFDGRRPRDLEYEHMVRGMNELEKPSRRCDSRGNCCHLRQLPPSEYQQAQKRNLHVWAEWRQEVNDGLVKSIQKKKQSDIENEMLVMPLEDAIALESPHDPLNTCTNINTLMNYSVGVNDASSLDSDKFLQYGIPRARVKSKTVTFNETETAPRKPRAQRMEAQTKMASYWPGPSPDNLLDEYENSSSVSSASSARKCAVHGHSPGGFHHSRGGHSHRGHSHGGHASSHGHSQGIHGSAHGGSHGRHRCHSAHRGSYH